MEQAAVRTGFVHEAFPYAGHDEFVAGTVPFIVDGLNAGEPVMVAVSAVKIDLLRSALGRQGDAVVFADMDDIGCNPARIIPAWHDFLATCSPGHQPARGIGEPIGPGRSPAAVAECQRNEVLLNAAFATRPSWWLVCPYDTAVLAPPVVDEAWRSHPFVFDGGTHRPNAIYDPGDPAALAMPLPEPAAGTDRLRFGHDGLAGVRRFVAAASTRRGLDPSRLPDLLVAINELATNSVRHGGGGGVVRVWEDGDAVVCEVSDAGVMAGPLVGRRRPTTYSESGRGVWIVNQLCDLVEMRSTPAGTVIRVHMSCA